MAVLAGALIAPMACTGIDDDAASARLDGATTVEAAASSPPATAARGNRDGELRLGTLLPLTGAGAATGVPMVTGVAMAVRDINAGGGVHGRPVVMVTADEGEGPGTALVALDRLLLHDRVDAVVGPATSRTTLALLDELRRAETPSCSPAATAAALTEGPAGGLFVRTIGSDRLEGTAVGQVIAETGRARVAVLAPDDDYGAGMTEAIATELDRQGAIVASVVYQPDAPDVSEVVDAALATDPEAIAVVGLPEPGGRILSALDQAGVHAGVGADDVLVVVTDGLRVPDLYQRVSPGRRDATAGVWGVAPATVPGLGATNFAAALDAYAPGVAPDYAAYAYDCTILLALAAHAAGDAEPSMLMRSLLAVSGGGERCDTYATCAALLAEGIDIDYAGAGGQVDLTATGDTDRGVYDVFEFNADGSTTVRARPTVRLP